MTAAATEVCYGVVCWFSNKKNYGFISRDGEKDIFCHFSDIICEGFKTLKKGQKVQFKLGLNHQGVPKAVDIVVIGS